MNPNSTENFQLTEEDIKNRFITPALKNAGWDADHMWMEHYFTDGQMEIRGEETKRKEGKKADYILEYKNNLPLAIVEAKDQTHGVSDGLQQAIDYAGILDIPFAYSSNGKGFVEHDMTTGLNKDVANSEFPSPEELWERYISDNNISPKQEEIITQPYYFDTFTNMTPRYYQRIAINKTIEAISKDKKRILLVMATGTGKTFTAFQIVHRLKKSGFNRVLYLADRNILIDQSMSGDFKSFGDKMTKVADHELDSAFEIHFALYQQLIDNQADEQPYKNFMPDFFDLIIVDECHRGSAKEDSAWRQILEYFSSATQIGMTATPKEDKHTSNINYFGEPIYEYSLRQGIEDGFLAPYKVIKIIIDKDILGYVPEKDKIDVDGNLIENREYNVKDYDKKMIIDNRTQVVAKKITEYLKESGDRFAKTIVFCVDINHAERMRRALANENADLVKENPKYVMRITGDDKVGKSQLDNFIEDDETYPVIVTTSELLSTGVNCKTCKLIALDTNIESMTKFKQIIGRGTRLKEEYGKKYFTIMDFRNNSVKFQDPEFDGKATSIYEGPSNKPLPHDVFDGGHENPNNPHFKYHVNDVEVNILAEQHLFFDKEGNLITEKLIKYSHDKLVDKYKDLNTFINIWNREDKKKAIIEELYNYDIPLEQLKKESGKEEWDDFDLICHIAFDKKPLTRAERVNNVKKRDYFTKYEGVARKVLEGLLDKYASGGIESLENIKILSNEPFKQYGTPMQLANEFYDENKDNSKRDSLIRVFKELRSEIYA